MITGGKPNNAVRGIELIPNGLGAVEIDFPSAFIAKPALEVSIERVDDGADSIAIQDTKVASDNASFTVTLAATIEQADTYYIHWAAFPNPA